jgi:hypothetical protein
VQQLTTDQEPEPNSPDDLDLIGCPVFSMPAGSTDKMLLNLKQYRTGTAKHGYLPGPGYIGQFTIPVRDLIRRLVSGSILHLYSGTSDIGTTRVDLSRPEATHNISVEEFITQDGSSWDWCVLDPPYRLIKSAILKPYQDGRSLSGNALLRDRLCLYFQTHVANVLWLDYCCPTIKGFSRQAIWLILPARHFENVRCLSWLTKTPDLLNLQYPGPGSPRSLITNPPGG